jgi:6,7-dimethyl-8-ribityllumazine synthase
MKIGSAGNTFKLSGKDLKIAVVFSKFNDEFGNELLFNTVETLKKHHVNNIHIEKVPGSLEIPLCAKLLAKQEKYDAIIALGIVVKGKTYHFELVCNETYRCLMDISLQLNTPIIFGVICGFNKRQIIERCSAKKLNKGKEFAETAIEIALMKKKFS